MLEVFSDPVGLFAGAETVGDRLMVLPVLFLLLWRHLLLVELDRLCRTIYQNHRQALDLIYARVGASRDTLIAAIAESLRQQSSWQARVSGGFKPFSRWRESPRSSRSSSSRRCSVELCAERCLQAIGFSSYFSSCDVSHFSI